MSEALNLMAELDEVREKIYNLALQLRGAAHNPKRVKEIAGKIRELTKNV